MAASLVAAVAAAAAPPAVPADVRGGLGAHSIGVEQALSVSSSSLAVKALLARRIVKREFGWVRGAKPAVYLVRITTHPGVFDPPIPGAIAWSDIHPLQVGDLAWLVVIRSAKIPVLGPRGGSYRATLAVLVETTEPRFVVGITMPAT